MGNQESKKRIKGGELYYCTCGCWKVELLMGNNQINKNSLSIKIEFLSLLVVGKKEGDLSNYITEKLSSGQRGNTSSRDPGNTVQEVSGCMQRGNKK